MSTAKKLYFIVARAEIGPTFTVSCFVPAPASGAVTLHAGAGSCGTQTVCGRKSKCLPGSGRLCQLTVMSPFARGAKTQPAVLEP